MTKEEALQPYLGDKSPLSLMTEGRRKEKTVSIHSALLAMEDYAKASNPTYISVNDRLPDDNHFKSILVRSNTGRLRKTAALVGRDWCGMELGKTVEYKNVTHWIDLPDFPEE